MLRVLTTALTSPELLRVQADALHEYLPPHRLYVVNDAYEAQHFSNHWTHDMPDAIQNACQEVGAVHWRFPDRWHFCRWMVFPGTEYSPPAEFQENPNANTRCADATQYGIDRLLKLSSDPILLLDADMIPYRPFDVEALLAEHPIWRVSQSRPNQVEYAWNGLFMVDPRRVNRLDLLNFDCGTVNGERVDVGGQLHWWLLENQGLVGDFGHFHSADHWAEMQDGLPRPLYEFMMWSLDHRINELSVPETYADSFAHLRAGGNWEVRDAGVAQERLDRFIAAVTA